MAFKFNYSVIMETRPDDELYGEIMRDVIENLLTGMEIFMLLHTNLKMLKLRILVAIVIINWMIVKKLQRIKRLPRYIFGNDN